MQRQPVHDFEMAIDRATEEGAYVVRLEPPAHYNRRHLGNIDLIKAAEEAIVRINQEAGLEAVSGLKHLVEVRLRMAEEITSFDGLRLELRLLSEKFLLGGRWQRWSFRLGKNTGHVTVRYA